MNHQQKALEICLAGVGILQRVESNLVSISLVAAEIKVDEFFLLVDSASFDGYCSAEVPEYVSISNEDDDLPVRWKAPECLTENRYSPTSDVWAFGVLMYEVLTYGCIPYRHVFRDDEVPHRVSNSWELLASSRQ